MPRYPNPAGYTGPKATRTQYGQIQLDSIPYATATTPGMVQLSLDIPSTYPSNTLVPTVTAVKDYVDSVAIGGAPIAQETVTGIGNIATDVQTLARTASTPLVALFLTPTNLTAAFADTGASGIGSGTPRPGAFTTLDASGLITGLASATIDTGGTALNLGTDASNDNINLGTGLGTRTVAIGNAAASTAVTITSGTGHVIVTSTGTGDINLVAGDKVNVDAAGTVEINSSAGVIGIGNDAVAQNINIGTGAAQRVITIGNASASTSVVVNGGGGNMDFAQNAVAQTVRIGNITGASSLALRTGTGSFTLDGVGASDYTIGASTTTGAISIGGTAQEGATTIVSSTAANDIIIQGGINVGAQTVSIANGATAANSTVSILSGIGTAGAGVLALGNNTRVTTIGIGNIANAAARTMTVLGGNPDQNNTLSMMNGTPSAGIQTFNLLTNAGGTQAINIGNSTTVVALKGAVTINGSTNANVAINSGTSTGTVTIGNSAAGAITIDSAAGISIDAALASNFTVTGAGENLTLLADGGSVLVSSTENAALAIRLHANGGVLETIQLHADQGTDVASINLLSDVGGITLRATGNATADAINLEAVAGGVDIDAALQINIATSQSAMDAIRINASAGGIDIDAVGTAGEDINITNTGASVVIIATEAQPDAIVLNASDAAGGIDLLTGGGSIDLSSAGSVTMVAGTDTQAGDTCTVNKNVFACTFTGFTTAAAASQVFNITNSVITTTSQVILTVSNLGANDAQMTCMRVKQTAGQLQITTKNNGAAALNGNVVITGWVIG